MQYNVIYTALSSPPTSLVYNKTIMRNTFGAGQDIFITIVDENGIAIDCSGFDTYKKIYVGSGATKIIDGGDIVRISDGTDGKYSYPITATDFSVEATDVGTWDLEIILGDNATYGSQTERLVAGGAVLHVVDTIMD